MKVISFQTGISNSGFIPYVSALLDCGHVASVTLKARRGTCYTCQTEQELGPGKCVKCGVSRMFTLDFTPHPHHAEDRLTQIGDEIDCSTCAEIARSIAWIESLDPQTVHHIRYRPRFGGTYTFYKLDHTSPSNFMSIGGCYANAQTDAAIARKGLCGPISPTEKA